MQRHNGMASNSTKCNTMMASCNRCDAQLLSFFFAVEINLCNFDIYRPPTKLWKGNVFTGVQGHFLGVSREVGYPGGVRVIWEVGYPGPPPRLLGVEATSAVGKHNNGMLSCSFRYITYSCFVLFYYVVESSVIVCRRSRLLEDEFK